MGLWQFVYVENSGVLFGLFSQSENQYMPVFLSFFGVLALIIVSYGLSDWVIEADMNLRIIVWGLLLGGAIGNVGNRIVMGSVVDFIYWHYQGFHWPVFNMADVAIDVGLGGFILLEFKSWRAKRKEKLSAPETD